jgi:hypothetical protein
VSAALGHETGFTHMEWFRKPDGEVVFGEIGARSPGGRFDHGMNVSVDATSSWRGPRRSSRAASRRTSRRSYNAAMIFKRAQGGGDRIARIDGLSRVMAEDGEHVPLIDLVAPGQPRRDWRQVVTGDGWMVARHPDLGELLRIADRLSNEVRIVAG